MSSDRDDPQRWRVRHSFSSSSFLCASARGAWRPSSGRPWLRFCPRPSVSGARRPIFSGRPQWVASWHQTTRTSPTASTSSPSFPRARTRGARRHPFFLPSAVARPLLPATSSVPPPHLEVWGAAAYFLWLFAAVGPFFLADGIPFPCATTCRARRPSSGRSRSRGPLPWPARRVLLQSLRGNTRGARLLIRARFPGLIFMAGDHRKSPRGNTRGAALSVRGRMASPSWHMASDPPQVLERKRSRPRRHPFFSAVRGRPASSPWPGTTSLPFPRARTRGARRPTSSCRPRPTGAPTWPAATSTPTRGRVGRGGIFF